jgi:hypothetical protein
MKRNLEGLKTLIQLLSKNLALPIESEGEFIQKSSEHDNLKEPITRTYKVSLLES